jgi:hypothetical protein
MEQVSPGVKLARDLIRLDQKIHSLIENNKLNFDVWEEDGKGFVETGICNVGGCTISKEFNTLAEAQRRAAIMTLSGEEIYVVSICADCRNSAEGDTICPNCGIELEPMYDEHPNWIKFCPKCDYRVG